MRLGRTNDPPPPLVRRCAVAQYLEAGLHTGGVADLAAAVSAYNDSAARGNASARFTMGVLHAHGLLGVPLDEQAALLHYYFAALAGHAPAQLALGCVRHCKRNTTWGSCTLEGECPAGAKADVVCAVKKPSP